ncbi:hypothetical protein CU097_010176 [Rhizopus azygosporus]|uniref:F-box domain-containing protein n=1 Tax=Rhizopus azygosporus TaxID=86630 RepID=A0A367K452_RHIAZ|nr:hypothetical protein CU097_010176 [Rhizopus azygosporus]
MSIKQVPLQAKNVNSRGTFDTIKVNDETIKPLKSRSDQVTQRSINNIRHISASQSTQSKKTIKKYHSQPIHYDDLFVDNDTPIFRLPPDCMMLIFAQYNDAKTLTTLASVCRRWRRTILQPHLWKDTYYQLYEFNQLLKTLCRPYRTSLQLSYIQSLTISSSSLHQRMIPGTLPRLSAFKQLKKIHLIDLYIDDISKITKLFSHVKVLICDNIRRDDDRCTIHLSIFSHLLELEDIRLHFDRPCNLGGPIMPFMHNRNVIAPVFPPCLKSLHLLNVYDFEESLIRLYSGRPVPSSRTSVEQDLLMKYKMLTSQIRLTTLTLNRCSSFTANIWRLCMIPCTKNLEYLSLTGWKPPVVDRVDSEEALTDFFGGLKQIKEIKLHDFVCTPGLVRGIKKLARSYQMNGQIGAIEEYLHQTLFDLSLSFQSGGVRHSRTHQS